MYVKLNTITPDIEKTIVEIARVSSSRKDKSAKPEGLINYLINNSHWSPFEHGFLTFEIETSRAIAAQLLRHRSNYFQEFSQRYQDVNVLDTGHGIFEPVELRKKTDKNRQSSEEVFDPDLPMGCKGGLAVACFLEEAEELYNQLIEAEVATECARMILPLCTKTKIYVTMNVRSLIHWLQLRDDHHSQKEVRDLAVEVKKIAKKELPIISKALEL
jgi:thymidylate synthase (FAD)